MIDQIQTSLLNREEKLFEEDILNNLEILKENVNDRNFLIIGGAGTIGQAVAKEIFDLNPKRLHVIDLSENNLVELVRDIRSSSINDRTEFKTFAIDVDSSEFDAFCDHYKNYDFVLNLSALKHVRSEKDPFTLSRLINVNIFNSVKIAKFCKKIKAKKYFCVSTDKAANPTNMMGSSKKIMESFLMRESDDLNISFSRFANVAFSDGSLLHGFDQRFLKNQPFSAPKDIKRYFISKSESGELCLLSTILAENREIFFPKPGKNLKEITFSEIAENYISSKGFTPIIFNSEDEAKKSFDISIQEKKWPCYFFNSDTTGEKELEEFYTKDENLDLQKFESIGVIQNNNILDNNLLDNFEASIYKWRNNAKWEKSELVQIFKEFLPEFVHEEKGKDLDQKM